MTELNTQVPESQLIPRKFYGEIATDFSHLEQLQSEWGRLWQNTPGHDLFQHFAWMRAWWGALGRGWNLFTPVIYGHSGIAGILPLIRRGRELRFLGYLGGDYNNLLAEPQHYGGALQCALELLLKESRHWDTCLLNNVSERSLLPASIGLLPPRLRHRLLAEFDSTCPALVLGEDKDQVLSALIRKESLRRHRKKLEKAGEIRFRHISDPEEQLRRLPEFFSQHIARRGCAGGRSEFLQPDFVAFFEALLAEFTPLNFLRFSVLEVGQRSAAYHFGFEAEHKYIWYKPSFDVNLWELGPGEVLLQSLFADIRERAVREFDFTWGDEQFKNRFANVVRTNYLVRFSSDSARGKLYFSAARNRASLKKTKRPARYARWVSGLLSQLASRVHAAGGLVPALRNALSASFHRFICHHVNTPVYCASLPRDVTHNATERLKPFSLAEIAGVAHHHPDFLTAPTLYSFRERLKRGDTSYAVCQNGELACLAWIGDREEIPIPAGSAGSDCVSIPESGTLIYDCWFSKPIARSGKARQFIVELVDVAAARQKPVWVSAEPGRGAGGREFEAAGLRLAYQVHSLQVLGRKRKQWIERYQYGKP